MRAMIVVAMLAAGCRDQGAEQAKQREIDELRQQVEALAKQKAAPPPVAHGDPLGANPVATNGEPPTPDPTVLHKPKEAADKAARAPRTPDEWCSFNCFKKAVADQMTTGVPSNVTADDAVGWVLGRITIAGGVCVENTCTADEARTGCRLVERHNRQCKEVLAGNRAIPNPDAVCDVHEIATIAHCCITKHIDQRVCRLMDRGKLLTLDSGQKASALADILGE